MLVNQLFTQDADKEKIVKIRGFETEEVSHWPFLNIHVLRSLFVRVFERVGVILIYSGT